LVLYHFAELVKKADVNTGLGQAWLLRSQNSLARIQLEEGSPTSAIFGEEPQSAWDDDVDEAADTASTMAEANNRRHTSNYVEARGTLIPATEYLTRAVNIAARDGLLRGHLLSLVRFSDLMLDKRALLTDMLRRQRPI
jgi:hypothetical protein